MTFGIESRRPSSPNFSYYVTNSQLASFPDMSVAFLRTCYLPSLRPRSPTSPLRRPRPPPVALRPPYTMATPTSSSGPGKSSTTGILPVTPPLYSVAPMMDVTDRHYRALARLISRHATLYTEMVVDQTLIHNPKLREWELRLPETPSQSPVVLQLGGSDAATMGKAAVFAAGRGYSEVNINCGCPSPKVAGNGCFGAALMRSPSLVADIVNAVAQSCSLPVTVKCRLGLGYESDIEPLRQFIRTISEDAGVTHFILHARNAILGGLSPAQNRSVPPLRYDDVYAIIKEFPHLRFTINGGIRAIDDVLRHLQVGVYGVMIGRAAMDAPWTALAEVDSRVYGQANLQPDGQVTTRRHVLNHYVQYAQKEISDTGCSVRAVIKPILNLFYAERNGKLWRKSIDEALRDPHKSVEDIVATAAQVIPPQVLDAKPGEIVVFPPAPSTYVPDGERCSEEVGTDGITEDSPVAQPA